MNVTASFQFNFYTIRICCTWLHFPIQLAHHAREKLLPINIDKFSSNDSLTSAEI